jgi:hypothetical protein
MKTNRIILSLLALLVIVFSASCASSTNSLHDDTGNQEGATLIPSNSEATDLEKNAPVFLIVQSESSDNLLNNEFYDFDNAAQYGVYSSSSSEVLSDLENTTRQNPLNKQEDMEYAYSDCSYKNESSAEYGTYYSVYDFYRTADGTDIAFLHDTDLICYYFKSHHFDEDEVVQLTKEEAQLISDEFIVSLLGNDIVSTYDNVYVQSSTISSYYYAVFYTKQINGYQTDASIMVLIDRTGTIVGYNGYNVCKYDALLDKFDDDKITSAKDKLITKLTSLELTNFQMNDPTITTDVDGNLYLEIAFSFENAAGMDVGEVALVKVS